MSENKCNTVQNLVLRECPPYQFPVLNHFLYPATFEMYPSLNVSVSPSAFLFVRDVGKANMALSVYKDALRMQIVPDFERGVAGLTFNVTLLFCLDIYCSKHP